MAVHQHRCNALKNQTAQRIGGKYEKKLSIVTLIRMEKVIELARMSWKVSRDLVGEDAEETKEHYITLKTMEYMFEVVTGVDYQTYRSLGRKEFL